MKTHLRTLTRCLAIGLLLVAFLPACSRHDAAGGKKSNIDYWTCTMHPSVHAKDPGNCPICAMTLVPVLKRDAYVFFNNSKMIDDALRFCRILSDREAW
jgi:hypothetical protein